MKQGSFDKNQKAMDDRLKEIMNKLEESQKMISGERKEWEKEKAIMDIKMKQQIAQIEELSKKEKTLELTLNTSKGEMSQQVREITQRQEREKEEIKNKLK